MPTVADHRDQIAQITYGDVVPDSSSVRWRASCRRSQARSSLYFLACATEEQPARGTPTDGFISSGATAGRVLKRHRPSSPPPSNGGARKTFGQTPRANPTCRRYTRASTTYSCRAGPDAPPAKASGGQTRLANRSGPAIGRYLAAHQFARIPEQSKSGTLRISPCRGGFAN